MKKNVSSLIAFLLTLTLSAGLSQSADIADVAKGKQVYDTLCWVCHGKYGRGDGPAANSLTIKPADLTDYQRISIKTDAKLFQWISGRDTRFAIPAHAPIWRETLTDQAVKKVVAYIRTLSAPDLRGSVAAGRDLFKTYCVVCHGTSGTGDGPAAVNLNPKPQDLTNTEFQNSMNHEKLFASISSGPHKSAYMPIWGVTLNQQEIWDLVEHIKNLSSSAKAD
ncbi:MAG: cytochrome c [Thermodesulfobacteriota bacterium]